LPDNKPPFAKILVAITEDWFLLSHFRPLIAELRQLAREVIVVTRASGRLAEVQSLGVRTIELDYNRSSMNPVREAATIRQFTRILRAEKPDVLHLIAMKPIVVAGLAGAFAGVPHTVVHITGFGYLAVSRKLKSRLVHASALAIARRVLNRPGNWLIAENPDDAALLAGPKTPVTILGGAGIDPQQFPALDPPAAAIPVAAYVGRMVRSKGVDVLMSAGEILAARGVPLAIELYGRSDDGNPEAVPASELTAWNSGPHRRWLGHTSDVAAVWRRADIFVTPTRGGEGLPRALLEAAASARPLIVTDVPGCRHFVRHGVEGLVVPPADASALADAMETLAGDPTRRRKLGLAARTRALDGHTEADVRAGLARTYRALASSTQT
jgi:glycosyltransferase involved in cell wall biosynthesis